MRFLKSFKGFGLSVIAIAVLTTSIIGCATLQPGADALVVRTEQSLSLGKPTFDLVLKNDNANRPFWMTNAPAYHQFCEWLRQPQPVTGGTLNGQKLPRATAMLYGLDMVKLDYKAAKTAGNSNALFTALGTFNGALNQASGWILVVTNTVVPKL